MSEGAETPVTSKGSLKPVGLPNTTQQHIIQMVKMRRAWIIVALVAFLAVSSSVAAKKKDKAKAKKKAAPADDGPPMPPKDETWKKKHVTDYK